MNIRQSVLGEIVTRVGNEVSGIDAETLLRRFLLFDSVIVKSVGLREIPFLIRVFGKSGFLQLLNSKVLKISCESLYVCGAVAQNGIPSVPPLHFTFGLAELADREKVLRRNLIGLQGIKGLKNTERKALEDVIICDLVRPHADYGPQLQAQIELDIRNNTPALRVAIAEQLKKEVEGPLRPFEIQVEEPQTRVFHVITDISMVYGFSEEKTHGVLQTCMFGVANLNQRIADMMAYSAIAGFTEAEAPLLFGKFAGIVGPQNPEPIEKQFGRVLAIANLPSLVPFAKVDADKLLRARESTECLEFREWLTKLDCATDEQIAEMVNGIRNKVASVMHSTTGRLLRLAMTSAMGVIPGYGIAAGPLAGVLDSFLVDKLFPTSGVAAFLSNTYPSLFEHT